MRRKVPVNPTPCRSRSIGWECCTGFTRTSGVGRDDPFCAAAPRERALWPGRFRAEIPASKVVSFDTSAILAKTSQHFRHGRQSPTELGESHCRFGRWFAQRVAKDLQKHDLDPASDLFFGFDTNSLEVLEMLRKRGVFTVLDQVDAGLMHEDIVLEESERWPGWQKFPGRMPQSYWDRRSAEWAAANLVLVNSEWSRDALVQQGVPRKKSSLSRWRLICIRPNCRRRLSRRAR